MTDSIFTKILQGEIPGEVIYRDDTAAVLLTIEPFTPGHMLVVPLEQVDHLWEINETTYHHLWDIARQMTTKLQAAYGYERVGAAVEGFGVPHAHIHIFGYLEPLEDTLAAIHAQKANGNHQFASADELKAVADKLRNL